MGVPVVWIEQVAYLKSRVRFFVDTNDTHGDDCAPEGGGSLSLLVALMVMLYFRVCFQSVEFHQKVTRM